MIETREEAQLFCNVASIVVIRITRVLSDDSIAVNICTMESLSRKISLRECSPNGQTVVGGSLGVGRYMEWKREAVRQWRSAL
jgi:hypothetical protein